MFLHLSNVGLGLSAMTIFSNTDARAPISSNVPLFTNVMYEEVWKYSLN